MELALLCCAYCGGMAQRTRLLDMLAVLEEKSRFMCRTLTDLYELGFLGSQDNMHLITAIAPSITAAATS